MEPSKGRTEVNFIKVGLIFLFIALVFGVVGALQYVIPGLFRSNFSFEKVRPLHVSSAVFWILITSCGVVLHYQRKVMGQIWSNKLIKWQLFFFLAAMISILSSSGISSPTFSCRWLLPVPLLPMLMMCKGFAVFLLV